MRRLSKLRWRGSDNGDYGAGITGDYGGLRGITGITRNYGDYRLRITGITVTLYSTPNCPPRLGPAARRGRGSRPFPGGEAIEERAASRAGGQLGVE